MNKTALRVSAAAALLCSAAFAQTQPNYRGTGEDQPGYHDYRQDKDARQDRNRQDQTNRFQQQAQTQSKLIPVDWVMGARVLGEDRDRIGEINDLIVSARKDKVVFGLLEHGGVLGMGEHLIPIPWNSFEWDNVNRALVLPFSTDQLNSAPQMNREDWSQLYQPAWRQRMHEFFEGQGFSADGQRWLEKVRAGQPVTLRGTVREIDIGEAYKGGSPERVVRIVTDQGDERVVNLGPSWFVDRQRQMIRQGQQVEVNGVRVDSDNGQSVIVVKTINTPNGTFRMRDDQGRPSWDVGQDNPQRDVTRDGDRNFQRDNDQDKNADRGRDTDRGREFDRQNAANGSGAELIKVSQIKGQRVTQDDNTDIGKIDTVVFNPANGKLAYAVVTVGGFLGIGDTKYAVPWSYFTVNQNGKVFANKIDKETLRNAPKVETRNFAELQDEQFGARVFQHYGVEPTWMDNGQGGQNFDPNQGRDQNFDRGRDQNTDRNRSGARTDEFQQMFAQGSSTEFSGTVERMDTSGRMTDMVVRTDNGERIVKLAPQDSLQQLGLACQQGDRVTVVGRSATYQSQRVILPQEVTVNGRSITLRDEDGRPVWRQAR